MPCKRESVESPRFGVLGLALGLSLLTTACGGGGGGSGAANSTPTSGIATASVVKGPVLGATVEGREASTDNLVVSYSLGTPLQDIQIPSNATYPMVLRVVGGTDMFTGTTPAISLEAVIVDPGQNVANINPLTSLIVAVARALPGGVTASNITTARQRVAAAFPVAGGYSPLTTPIDAASAGPLIMASEALAEIVLRAAAWNSNPLADVEYVMAQLGADLANDGLLDGEGGDSITTAFAYLAAAQVLTEAMAGQLRLSALSSGAVLSDANLSNAQQALTGSQNGSGDAALPMTAELLHLARVATNVAQEVQSSPALQGLENALDSVSPRDAPDPAYLNQALAGSGTSVAGAQSGLEAAAASLPTDPFSLGTILAAAGGPVAIDDNAQAKPKGPEINIDVLANDTGNAIRLVSIVEAPAAGAARVDGTQAAYTPPDTLVGQQEFSYRIEDADGRADTAHVSVTLDTLVTVSWSPNPSGDQVLGYLVYRGSAANAPTELITNTNIETGFNAGAPSVYYGAAEDLGAAADESVCFAVKAFSRGGVSDFSSWECVVPLPL